MTGFATFAIETCEIRVLAGMGKDRKSGPPTLIATDVPCTPLDPLSSEMRQTRELSKPYAAVQTFIIADVEIKEGYELEVDGVIYTVRMAMPWVWIDGDDDEKTTHVVLERSENVPDGS